MEGRLPKPHPVPTPDTVKFWEGVQRKELLLQRCCQCGRHQFYPRSLCQHCWSEQLEWVPSEGKGQLYSYTVVHRPPSPAFEAPYVVAVVELEEGVRMMGNLVGCAPAEAIVGMPVRTLLVKHEDGLIPAFTPAEKSPKEEIERGTRS